MKAISNQKKRSAKSLIENEERGLQDFKLRSEVFVLMLEALKLM